MPTPALARPHASGHAQGMTRPRRCPLLRHRPLARGSSTGSEDALGRRARRTYIGDDSAVQPALRKRSYQDHVPLAKVSSGTSRLLTDNCLARSTWPQHMNTTHKYIALQAEVRGSSPLSSTWENSPTKIACEAIVPLTCPLHSPGTPLMARSCLTPGRARSLMAVALARCRCRPDRRHLPRPR